MAAISVAVVVCAWFVLGIVQERDLSHASAIIGTASTLSADQARRADRLLSSAATLNPDRQIDLDRAIVALDRNQTDRALAMIEHVTREEPQNVSAWLYLASAAYGRKALLNSAVSRIAVLDPFNPGR